MHTNNTIPDLIDVVTVIQNANTMVAPTRMKFDIPLEIIQFVSIKSNGNECKIFTNLKKFAAVISLIRLKKIIHENLIHLYFFFLLIM